uniref:Glycoprotein n=1 Tax=Citrus leprosis virus TaxID=242130 RepID=A0A0H4IR51_9RHAB|nr:glycoprotein [Citrus leprosis virus]
MMLKFVIILILSSLAGFSALSLVPKVICDRTVGLHVDEWLHSCLGACQSSDVEADMTPHMLMEPALSHFKAFGYFIHVSTLTKSSHTYLFGGCHISSQETPSDSQDLPINMAENILRHGGPEGEIIMTKEPQCNLWSDNYVKGLLVRYHRVILTASQTKSGVTVIYEQEGVIGEGKMGKTTSPSGTLVWDIRSQYPKCNHRPTGVLSCKTEQSYLRCRGMTEERIVSTDEDCGVLIMTTDTGNVYGHHKQENSLITAQTDDNQIGMAKKIIEIENLMCHHLCESSSEEGGTVHNEYLASTPIGPWLSVSTETHRTMFMCTNENTISLVVPVVMCGNGPLVKVRVNEKEHWWNVSSPYIGMGTHCVPGLSTGLATADGVINTWLGQVTVENGSFMFKRDFINKNFHGAFRPSHFSWTHITGNDLEDIVSALRKHEQVLSHSHVIESHSVGVGENVLQSFIGVFTSVFEWIQNLIPNVKGWIIKIFLWVLLAALMVLVLWILWKLLWLFIRSMFIRRTVRAIPTSEGSDTSLNRAIQNWAKMD